MADGHRTLLDTNDLAATLRRVKPGRQDALISPTSYGLVAWIDVVTTIAGYCEVIDPHFDRLNFLQRCDFVAPDADDKRDGHVDHVDDVRRG